MGILQLLPGSLFANRFEIQRTAGSGGMGTVYRAVDRHSGDPVALKLHHPDLGAADEAARFTHEAQLLLELRHPGIVAHVAHGQVPGGQRFLAMEWLEGQDLGERLARGPLPIRDCVRLLEQVADALAVAHQRGVIHRDLKPTNLFLVGNDVGRVKLLDFGIARRINRGTSKAMTKTGVVIGTPEYMAPEQARGSRNLTPAADLFSLGCVLYECLTGQPPFLADHIAAVLVRILFEEPAPVEYQRPGVPEPLLALLGRLLTKNPEERLADSAALRRQILSLGVLPEPALIVTMVPSRPHAESFAEEEQSLFSIVLAAPEEAESAPGATQPGSDFALAAAERQVLLQALTTLGGSPDFLANGTLVVTVPQLGSAHDQATLAARAALLIKERWPDAVVSMATGRGAIRGRTAVGEVVERAARSLKRNSQPAVAKPISGVRIDPLSARLLEARFAQTPQPDGALLLYEEREVDASRPLLGKATPCVGREAELVSLESQLSVCIDESEARVMLVTAPPGAGKSRLRHEFMRRGEKRSAAITVLLGRGDRMSAGAPYGILRTALHQLCGVSGSEPLETQRELLRRRITQHLRVADAERVVLFIGELCHVPFPQDGHPMLQAARQEPQLMRDALRRALLDFLAAECAAAPVLLVLDDLQWGDALTVGILDEALREQIGAPLCVLSFARPEVHEVFPKLWQRHKMQEILLKGLSKRACERLIVQVLGKDVPAQFIARAVEQSAGNALFLEEIIRASAEDKSATQSETVVAMLQARLGRLDANARRAVRAASVFGQTFWGGGVLAILGAEGNTRSLEEALEVLVRAELIYRYSQSRIANEVEYGFRHVLIRDATYALLTQADQELGHRLACTYLEKAGERDPLVLAEHAHAGRDFERAVRFYLRAADESSQRNDLVGMAARVEQGLACGARGAALGQLLALKLEACYWRQDHQTARAIGEEALSLLSPGSRWWGKTLGALIGLSGQMADPTLMNRIIEELLRHKPDPEALVPYYEAVSNIILGAGLMGLRDLVLPFKERLASLDSAELAQEALARGYIGFAMSMFYYYLEFNPYLQYQHTQRAVAAFEQAQSTHWHNMVVMGEAVALEVLGELGLAERMLRQSLKEALARNNLLEVASAHSHLLFLLAEACRPEQLAETAELAHKLIEMHVMEACDGSGYGALARVLMTQGLLSQAEEAAEKALSILQTHRHYRARVLRTLIEIRLRQGRVADALKIVEEVRQYFKIHGGAGRAEVLLRVAIVKAYIAAGDLSAARETLEFILRLIARCAEEIPDPGMRQRYREEAPENVDAQELARTLSSLLSR